MRGKVRGQGQVRGQVTCSWSRGLWNDNVELGPCQSVLLFCIPLNVTGYVPNLYTCLEYYERYEIEKCFSYPNKPTYITVTPRIQCL